MPTKGSSGRGRSPASDVAGGKDVTDRKRVEEKLRESEARYRYLIGTWAQAVWETDAAGVIIADSSSWRAYTGQTPDEWRGHGWLDAVHPDDRAYAARLWREAIAIRGLVDVELRLRAPDGGWRWTNVRATPLLDAGGNIEKWVGINIDVDARKRAEGALRDSEVRYRMLFETMDEGYLVADVIFDENGKPADIEYLHSNPAAVRIVGTDLTGRRLRDVSADYEDYWYEIWGRVARSGNPERLERYAKPGEIWYEFNVFKIEPDSRESRRVGVLFQDVTARKRAEAALRESEERHAYLLELNDALRPLTDPEAIQDVAMRLLGQRLRVSRAQYYTADETGEYLSSSGGYSDGVPAAIGRFRLIEFGKYAYDGFHAGETQVVSDARIDTRISEAVLKSYETVGFLAYIGVPFVQRGRFLGTIAVHQAGPREWTDSERIMVEETAERAGIAVEQARAELALRESEGKYRTLFNTMDEGYAVVEVLRDKSGRVFDVLGVEVNDAYTAKSGIPETFVGRRFSEFSSLEDRWLQIYDDVSRTGLPVRTENYWEAGDRWLTGNYSRVGGDGSNLVAIVFDDVTKRKKAEISLRESEERQAFLLKLSDSLRAEPTADAIGALAIRLLADHLSLDRCYIVSRRNGGNLWDVGSEVRKPGLPAMPPIFDQDEFPEALRVLSDQTLVIEDTAARTDFTDTEKQGLLALGFGGLLMATLRTGAKNPNWSMVASSTLPRRWTSSEIRLVEEANERTWAAMERARAEAALRESEERFQQFGEASQDVLWIRDAKTLRWTYLTPAFEEIYGISRDEALGAQDYNTWLELILPEDREVASAAIASVRIGERAAFEYRIRRPVDGQVRWLRNTDFPILDAAGRVTMIGGVGHDITQLKDAEEHQALLVAELQHRVRNTLAIIRNIVRQTAERSASIEENTAHLEGRIGAFARVQAAVTRNPAAGIDISSLIAEELRAAGGREGENLTIQGPPLMLKPKAAETFGLAVHELATNAVKYGALSGLGGKIDIRWTVDRDKLLFQWTERGLRDLKPAARRGFGSEILEQTLPYSLKAETRVSIKPTGLAFTAEMPVSALAGE